MHILILCTPSAHTPKSEGVVAFLSTPLVNRANMSGLVELYPLTPINVCKLYSLLNGMKLMPMMVLSMVNHMIVFTCADSHRLSK